jgi:sulfate adenylyltransferase subunit 1 (EFTu-like GTPase family)
MADDTCASPEADTPATQAALRVVVCDGDPGSVTRRAARGLCATSRLFAVTALPGDRADLPLVAALSSADVVLLPVDARVGLVASTRRMIGLASICDVRDVVLAVENADAVPAPATVITNIASSYRALVRNIALPGMAAIPVFATPDGEGAKLPRPVA